MVPADLIEEGNELKKPLRTVLIKVKIKKRTVSTNFYDYSFVAVNEKHLEASDRHIFLIDYTGI